MILEGFTFSYKMLSDGRRQITALEMAGDLCNPDQYFLSASDHSIRTLTPCKIASISHQAIGEITEAYPPLTLQLWRHTSIDADLFRDWMSDRGQCAAYARVAHFLCETLLRLKVVGLAPEGSFELPLNQLKIGDLLGFTPIHLSRMVNCLGDKGLITTERETVTIPDREKLKNAGDFKRDYLHLNSRPNARPAAAA